jgi:hypothetical protein
VPDPIASTAASRARRTVLQPPPLGPLRPRRSRLLLLGLPMFAVFTAFGAIIWLAYERGPDGPPVGEPPLVKAPATAIKLAPDDSEVELAEGGEVLDMLSDSAPADQLERLLPPPEAPLAPAEQAAQPPPEQAAEATAQQAAEPPVGQAATSPPASAEAEAAVAALPEPAPDSAVVPAPEIIATPLEKPRISPPEVPLSAASVPEPTPEEAEAALDALLAEVTEQAAPPVAPPPAPAPAQAGAPNGPVPPAVRPAVAPPVSQAATPPAGPSGEVTAIAPDRRPAASGASAAPSPRPQRSQVAAVEGPYRIQLAAVRDEADARRAWDLFQVDLGPVLAGREPFIERAETANGVFYRVQFGAFASLQEAEALCDQLKQRNASCFVIRR